MPAAGADSVAGKIAADAVGFVAQEEMPATDFAAHLAVLDSVGSGTLGEVVVIEKEAER